MRKFTSLPYTEFTIADGNFDTNRKTVKKIVIHSIVGTVGSAISRFGTPNAGVSAHYIIGNNGQLWAGLEEYYVAYHAGNYIVNQESIGIEHEWYNGLILSDELYEMSAKLVADICKTYALPCNDTAVVPHKSIVPTQCPNAVDVGRIIKRANEILNPPPPTPPNPCQTYIEGISFRDKVIGQRDMTIAELNKQIENLKKQLSTIPPPADCSTYINQINYVKDTIYGRGWWWTRINALRSMFPK